MDFDNSLKKTDLVKKIIRSLPEGTPTQTVAKYIWNSSKYKHYFLNLESIRSTVRRLRGASGKNFRNSMVNTQQTEFFTQQAWYKKLNEDQKYAEIYKEDLPESLIIPPQVDKLLILNDVHSPFTDREALAKALLKGLEMGCNGVLLNGDFMDCYALSRWEKEPDKRNFSLELQQTRDLLKVIRDAFPTAYIWYKFGNHENRHSAYLISHCETFYGVKEFKLQNLLQLNSLNIDYVEDDRIVKFGHLSILHGHEMGKSLFSPVNPARGLYLKTKSTACVGHHHQTSQHNEKDLEGKVTVCWTMGALCKLNPKYARYNKWNHGFAVVELVDMSVNFKMNNYSIINGNLA